MKRDSTGKFVNNWDSEKKQRFSISLTSTAWRSLDEEAHKQGISRSELIEYFARNLGNEPHPDFQEMQANAENALLKESLLQALEIEHTRFAAVLQQLPVGVLIADAATGKLVLANEQAKHIVGYDYEEFLELEEYVPITPFVAFRTDGQMYQPNDYPLARSLQIGEVVSNEELRLENDGRQTFISVNSAPIFNSQNQIVAAVAVLQDITERKQIEENLRQTEERLQLALSSAQIIAWDMDLITNHVVCSPNALWLWGREAGAAEDFMALIHPDDQQRIVQAAQKAAEGEIIYQQEYRIIAPDKTIRWINSQGRVYLDAAGRGVRIIGITVDITERKKLWEQVQHKERQQEFLIQLNDAIRPIQDSKEIMWQVVCAAGQHFQVSRCTYGEIDSTQEYVIVERDYCNGVSSVVGTHQMNSFGPEIIAELKQGRTIIVDDVDADPRTQGAGAAAFDLIQTKSLLCVPLVKQGKFIALLVLHHIAPRHWQQEEVTLIEQIAEQTWLAVERSRAEAELRESEAHLQLALNVGRMGSWDWDVQTGALHWSEGHFTVLGLQPYQCQPSYEVWQNRVHPNDLAQAEAKFQQAMQAKQEYHHEYRLRWLNGSIHWVEARGKFTYDLKGNPKNSIGVVIDITERKQIEQERERLLERERIARMRAETAQRQLTTIFETSPVGIALLDRQQRYIAINEALAKINGLTREQHLGHSIKELFGQVDPGIVAIFDEIYNTGDQFISLSLAINPPGRSDRTPGYYNVYYLPTINSNHQIEDVLAYVVDVTEQVRLERNQRFLAEASAVLASSLDYQTTLERVAQLAVPELADWCTVHIVKEDGVIEQIAVAHIEPAKLQWADQMRQKYPLNPDDPRGAAWTLRTGKSDFLPDIPDELLVQAAQNPEHLEILRSVGFKSVMTVPLKTQDKILGVISFIAAESGKRYDQSNLQLAEELARRASLAIDNAQLYRIAQRDHAKAEAANRIKDEFLAVLSHELRSPLNPILGWTRLLRSQRLDPKKADQALETIERNAKLQAQLIEDLLDVSRILQGKMSLNVAPVNLAATIEAALETVRLAAEAKNIQIQTTLNSLSGTVSGDPNRLQQVIWNLISNAVKFTPSGGQIEVQLEQVGMYAQIKVQDNGIGITPEFLPFVFEYFRQQDGATTRQFGGLGLGLAIVRHLTELHGGTVQADSPGQNLGAIFTVRLPLNVVDQALSSIRSNLEDAVDLTGMQILVVDDDADMRDLAEFILTEVGAQVTTADSALQALTYFNQSMPDLLISDIGMPEMDGYSLIRHIRQCPPEQGGTIPAIALSAYAGEINQQQALQAGFQQHVAKPIEPEELVRTIAILMGSRE
ncbi:chemotaxis protein CheY [Nostoc piscinale CENA21]|uniref:Circadian input-output histidine kinase CikA n=1 Tax=Nostoc piscinale CENA21 TaxID=224013 RepID=A0A0M4T787_9NOSO|nr:PAS domain S-box protein [Nostoc piscinale]ALF55216.1 chemotaxis protein CheY [Nostoc piscinale CENA21]